ncbi:uncharacterized protein LOC142327644 [Lycorma delicatula]|uniref:uncharacterized protein LOC142327644 n=1 Tax=Lycorma delicatula TaxID=130591 RepID=UPI003F513830
MTKTIFFLFCLLLLYDVCNTQEAYCTDINLEIRLVNKGYIGIYWEVDQVQEGDWIGLYNINFPKREIYRLYTKNFLLNINVKSKKNKLYSDEMFFKDIPIDFTAAQPLQYSAVYWRRHNNIYKPFIMSRLRTYPNWMYYYRPEIEDLPLNQIFIPGSYDSASRDYLEFSNEFKRSKQMLYDGNKKRLTTNDKYSIFREDTSILQQLVLGIRYLDIRVIQSSNGNYYAMRDYNDSLNMDSVIQQVLEFLNNTKELVIFDLRSFKSADENDKYFYHDDFVKYLKAKFLFRSGKYLVPRQLWTTKMKDILKDATNGKVIISYNNIYVQLSRNDGLIWNPVKHLCYGIQEFNKLTTCLEDLYTNNNNQLKDIAHAVDIQLFIPVNNDKYSYYLKKIHPQESTLYSIFMRKEIGLKMNILVTNDYKAMGTIRQAIRWNIGKYYFNSENEYPDKTCIKFNINNDEYYQTIFR